jgi:hypothetical protein
MTRPVLSQSVTEFAEWVRLGSGTAPSVGDYVFVRAGRGKTPAAFETLGAGPGRRLAWATSAKELAALGKSEPLALLKLLGKDQRALDQARDDGERWKLIVFATVDAELGDWTGLLRAMQRSYPADAVDRVSRHLDALNKKTLKELLGDNFERFNGAKKSAAHPDHMSLERYQLAEDTAPNARLFLWHALGLNDNYAGKGYTQDDDGRRGLSEYLVPNRPLSELGAVLVDLGV